MTAVTLIDSPVANAANIARALSAAGAAVNVTKDPLVIERAEKLVLPGVGSFRAAAEWLARTGIDAAIRTAVSSGAYLLGICVGHQLLFDESDEMGTTPGLGLLRGRVVRLRSNMPVPQIGWNRVTAVSMNPLLDGVAAGTPFYFVHSYAVLDARDAVATATYGTPFAAAVQRERLFGVQFHPEKSSVAGLRVLRNFVEVSA